MDVLLERKRIRFVRTLSVIFCSILVALVGCGGSSQTGTVSGTLTFEGGPVDVFSGASGGIRSARAVLLDSGGQRVATQEVKSGEHYRFEVAPDRYQLLLIAPGGSHLCGAPVRVVESETVDRALSCGIP
jgi:hypothetical protein